MTRRYIELDRDFVEVSKDYNFDEEHYESPFFYSLIESKKWDHLLKLKRAIILAGSGSGKTREIEEITHKLRKSGKQAFFFRLEHLATNFETAFEIGSTYEFSEWLSSDEQGWFFLDSVDEAKLKNPYEFKVAINAFASRINTAFQRANIYITGRFSAWHPHADLLFVKNKLPALEIKEIEELSDAPEVDMDTLRFGESESRAEKNSSSEVFVEPKIFALRPLSNQQIVKYASECGVRNANAFMREIERKEAEIFCDRPLDLEELINYWNLNGRLDGKKVLLESSIEAKLKESDNTRATGLPLSVEEARYGARLLSAATTFSRKSRILIPDSETEPYLKATTIDASKILTGWGENKSGALLQRPIFDQAVYGTVRFHARIVREFLTAQWLNYLLHNGKSRRAIESLFFAERYGEQVLVPSMRPILGWLVLLDEKIREKTFQFAPDVFIESGDPSYLPVEIRESILERFCEKISNGELSDHSFDINDLRRFSHPDLGRAINNLLKKYSRNNDIVETLLRMIWQGEIAACAEESINFAIAAGNSEYLKICGIRAVGW